MTQNISNPNLLYTIGRNWENSPSSSQDCRDCERNGLWKGTCIITIITLCCHFRGTLGFHCIYHLEFSVAGQDTGRVCSVDFHKKILETAPCGNNPFIQVNHKKVLFWVETVWPLKPVDTHSVLSPFKHNMKTRQDGYGIDLSQCKLATRDSRAAPTESVTVSEHRRTKARQRKGCIQKNKARIKYIWTAAIEMHSEQLLSRPLH